MHTSNGRLLAITLLALATPALAQVTFYEHDGFQGRAYTAQRATSDFKSIGFNDRASSAVVLGGPWEVCEDVRYGGQCTVLRPGRYASLGAMGLNDRVSSVRAVARPERIDSSRYAPDPEPAYDNRRRGNERLYQARVTSVRAVVGTPGQRCWVEREQLPASGKDNRAAGALLGAVLGGVLGHQMGGGSGRDIATVGGVVAGAAVGAQVGGRNRDAQESREVQRCADAPERATPDYWDVGYEFRGQPHQMQTTTPPGRTVTVNRAGEPRV